MRKRTFLLPLIGLACVSVAAPMAFQFRSSLPRTLGVVGNGPIEFSYDSRSLLSASSFVFEKIDLANGQRQIVTRLMPSRKSDGYPGIFHSYASAPDEKSGLVATNTGTFRFQSNQPQLKKTWPEEELPVHAVAISSDGKLMAGGHQLSVWTVKTEDDFLIPDRPLWKQTNAFDPPATVQFSPDGTRLAVGYFTGRIEMKEARTGKVVWVVKAPTPFPTAGLSYLPTDPLGKPANLTVFGAPGAEQIFFPVTFLSEAQLAYSNGRATFICDATTGKVIHTLAPSVVYDLAALDNGKTLVVAGKSSGEFNVSLWDAQTAQLQRVLQNSRRALYLAVSPDQKSVAALEDANGLKLWTVK